MLIVNENRRSRPGGIWRNSSCGGLRSLLRFCRVAEGLASPSLPEGLSRPYRLFPKNCKRRKQNSSRPGQGISSSSYWEKNEMVGNQTSDILTVLHCNSLTSEIARIWRYPEAEGELSQATDSLRKRINCVQSVFIDVK